MRSHYSLVVCSIFHDMSHHALGPPSTMLSSRRHGMTSATERPNKVTAILGATGNQQGSHHLLGSNYITNSLATGKFEWNFKYVIFKRLLEIDGWGISCEIALIHVWMSLDFTDDQSTFGSGNGLVPPGNKPLPKPMLTQICVAIWSH